MAREWQPASSFGPMPHQTLPHTSAGIGLSRSVSRNWTATRGAVLWDGAVDLAGSFPGFANWGSRAQSVRLTLTDHFLLVDEGTDYGFGLPIGWLTAAQALTGVEPISMETGDHLRVCYLDGDRIRGFTARVRGGRFGSRAGRRANQLRVAAMTLGLASPTPSTELLLPPEHDLSLDWDDFATYESEPVVWSGRASMPVGSGLESALCDVWLTSASLIWGASSRAGIYRIATNALAGITTAETPGHEPVIYWTVGGSHQTQVDLPMIFFRQDRATRDATSRDSLLDLVEAQGHRVETAAGPPQPWRTPVEIVRGPNRDDSLPETVPGNQQAVSAPSPNRDGSARPPARLEASRRRLMEDGLFPERVPPALPRSSPRPWGTRVERVEGDDAAAGVVDEATTAETAAPAAPADNTQSVADRLRIWPPAVQKRETQPTSRDASAMLVRRPRVRATTTEEFLASEQAARRAVEATPVADTPGDVPASDRGVLVRFRRPQTAVGGLAESVRRASGTFAAQSTSSFPVSTGTSDIRAEADTAQVAVQHRSGRIDQPVVAPDQTAANENAPARTTDDDSRGSANVASTNAPGTVSEIARDVVTEGTSQPESHLERMRSAVAGIEGQLAVAVEAVQESPTGEGCPVVAPTAPSVSRALGAIDAAVIAGELTHCAADTHRLAIARTADTTERLRSLLDLYTSGYLSLEDLETRRVALLEQPTIAART